MAAILRKGGVKESKQKSRKNPISLVQLEGPSKCFWSIYSVILGSTIHACQAGYMLVRPSYH